MAGPREQRVDGCGSQRSASRNSPSSSSALHSWCLGKRGGATLKFLIRENLNKARAIGRMEYGRAVGRKEETTHQQTHMRRGTAPPPPHCPALLLGERGGATVKLMRVNLNKARAIGRMHWNFAPTLFRGEFTLLLWGDFTPRVHPEMG